MFSTAMIMTRAAIPRVRMAIFRKSAKQVEKERQMSKLAEAAAVVVEEVQEQQAENYYYTEESESEKKKDISSSTIWVPHPRTGIYFPEGNEWVMEDVPKDAACFDRTYWIRNDDGVD